MLHGFVRDANGTTTTINVPGAGTGTLQGTAGVSINDSGPITGVYADGSGALHGFLLTPYPQAATPTFSPVQGNYNSAQTVTISDTTPGATIYYTTNGTTPTTSSTQYTGAITVTTSETIEAIATASDYSASPVASATYTITAAAPVAGVSPSILTFAAVMVNSSSSSQAVTLSNTGNAALAISSIAVSTNFAETNNCGSSVAAAGSCTINVTFTPSTGGALTGTLTITDNSNGAAGSTQTASLSGTGTAVRLSATSLSFGAHLVGSSSLKTVTLTNLGSTPLSISGLSVVSFAPLTAIATKAEDFTIQSGSCVVSGSVPGLAALHDQLGVQTHRCRSTVRYPCHR